MENKDPDFHFVNELTKAQPKMRAYLAKILANSSSTDDVLQAVSYTHLTLPTICSV